MNLKEILEKIDGGWAMAVDRGDKNVTYITPGKWYRLSCDDYFDIYLEDDEGDVCSEMGFFDMTDVREVPPLDLMERTNAITEQLERAGVDINDQHTKAIIDVLVNNEEQPEITFRYPK